MTSSIGSISEFGTVKLAGQHYKVIIDPDSYVITEIPHQSELEKTLERRVNYRNFKRGILPSRDDPALDAAATSAFGMRQTRASEGVWWGAGIDTTSGRIFAQRATSLGAYTGTAPFLIGDASVFSWAATPSEIQVLSPTTRTSTTVTATTMTDNLATWVVNQFVGLIVTTLGVSGVILSNTAKTLTIAVWLDQFGRPAATPGTGTYSISPAASWSQSASTFGVAITDAIQFNGKLFVAVGSANNYYTWTQATSTTVWAQIVGAGLTASYFCVVRNQLWRSSGSGIYSSLDGTIWSGVTVIGDPAFNITAIDLFQDSLMIFKQDGVYSADKDGNVYPVFPGFRSMGLNPRPIGQFRNTYLFASDVGMVWSYASDGKVVRIGFDIAEPYPMTTSALDVPNAATRGVSLPNFMVVGFNLHSNTAGGAYFLAWDGNAWHPYQYFPNAKCLAVGLTGGNNVPACPILQLAIQDNAGVVKMKYMVNPLLDPFIASSFDTASQIFYLPGEQGFIADESKIAEKISLIVDNPSAGSITAEYAVDDNIAPLSFIPIGGPIFDGFVNQEFFPPQDLPEWKQLLWRFTVKATSATSSPQIRQAMFHYKQRSPRRNLYTINILAAEVVIGPTGTREMRSVKKIVEDLERMRDKDGMQQFEDILGEKKFVYIDEIGHKTKILKGRTTPSFIITVKLAEAVRV